MEWKDLEAEVVRLIKIAAPTVTNLHKVLNKLNLEQIYYNPDEKEVQFYAREMTNKEAQEVSNKLQVAGVLNVKAIMEESVIRKHANYVMIPVKEACFSLNDIFGSKSAEVTLPDIFGPPADIVGSKEGPINKLWGGPRPVADALAGGALGAGAGYGAGWLVEKLLPDYFEKHRLRRVLGLAGGLAGAVPGIYHGIDNAVMGRTPFQSWPPPVKEGKDDNYRVDRSSNNNGSSSADRYISHGSSNKYADMEYRNEGEGVGRSGGLDSTFTVRQATQYAEGGEGYSLVDRPLHPLHPLQSRAWTCTTLERELNRIAEENVKYADDYPSAFASGMDHVATIRRGRLGQILWDDPSLDSSIASAATGLLMAAATQRGNAELISPFDVGRITAGMGSGLLSGLIVGRTLGAISGLSDGAQNRIMQAGVLAGLVSNVVPLAFGR